MAVNVECVNPGCRVFCQLRNLLRRGGRARVRCGNPKCGADIEIEAEPSGVIGRPKAVRIQSMVSGGVELADGSETTIEISGEAAG